MTEAKHSTESSLTQKGLDTISRTAAMEAFEDTTFTKNEILRRLSELPSVQPERKVGHWIIKIDRNNATYGQCSICGMKQYAGETNYCPNCGVRMEG